MKFSIKDFFSKCDQIRKNCGFGHIVEKILNEKLHFLCSECSLLNQNDSVIEETLLFGLNILNDEENAWIIESTIQYFIIHFKIHRSIVMNPFKQITTSPKISN